MGRAENTAISSRKGRRPRSLSEATVPSKPKTEGSEFLREQIYVRLCDALRSGQFSPGEKITIRALAAVEGMSPTPVREVLYRLVADGVLEAEANRSARVPLLTSEQIQELRDIRLAVETLAAERAAARASPALGQELRKIAIELTTARERGDIITDLSKVYEFQFTLYRASQMPALLKIIEALWLRTGPYLKLLFPHYVVSTAARRGDWRERICAAVERGDCQSVRNEIEQDLAETLGYVAEIVAASNLLRRRN